MGRKWTKNQNGSKMDQNMGQKAIFKAHPNRQYSLLYFSVLFPTASQHSIEITLISQFSCQTLFWLYNHERLSRPIALARVVLKLTNHYKKQRTKIFFETFENSKLALSGFAQWFKIRNFASTYHSGSKGSKSNFLP